MYNANNSSSSSSSTNAAASATRFVVAQSAENGSPHRTTTTGAHAAGASVAFLLQPAAVLHSFSSESAVATAAQQPHGACLAAANNATSPSTNGGTSTPSLSPSVAGGKSPCGSAADSPALIHGFAAAAAGSTFPAAAAEGQHVVFSVAADGTPTFTSITEAAFTSIVDRRGDVAAVASNLLVSTADSCRHDEERLLDEGPLSPHHHQHHPAEALDRDHSVTHHPLSPPRGTTPRSLLVPNNTRTNNNDVNDGDPLADPRRFVGNSATGSEASSTDDLTINVDEFDVNEDIHTGTHAQNLELQGYASALQESPQPVSMHEMDGVRVWSYAAADAPALPSSAVDGDDSTNSQSQFESILASPCIGRGRFGAVHHSPMVAGLSVPPPRAAGGGSRGGQPAAPPPLPGMEMLPGPAMNLGSAGKNGDDDDGSDSDIEQSLGGSVRLGGAKSATTATTTAASSSSATAAGITTAASDDAAQWAHKTVSTAGESHAASAAIEIAVICRILDLAAPVDAPPALSVAAAGRRLVRSTSAQLARIASHSRVMSPVSRAVTDAHRRVEGTSRSGRRLRRLPSVDAAAAAAAAAVSSISIESDHDGSRTAQASSSEVLPEFTSPSPRRRSLSGPLRNIVRYVRATHDEESRTAILSMEYLSGGRVDRHAAFTTPSLASDSPAEVAAREERLRRLARDVINGLKEAHNIVRVLHRDLKPTNIVFASDGTAKLIDFGCAALLSDPANEVALDQKGATLYMSPERLRGEPHGTPSDVWSLGVSLLELALGGQHPFARNPKFKASFDPYWALAAVLDFTATPSECAAAVAAATEAAVADTRMSAAFRRFVLRCLLTAPQERATLDELERDAWLHTHSILDNANKAADGRNLVPFGYCRPCVHWEAMPPPPTTQY